LNSKNLIFIATEELNSKIKQQIGTNNQNFNTANACIKHFARNVIIIDNERAKKIN
jgi:hypothetical protein